MTSKRCAVCQCFRRRCPLNCIFAPYFPYNNPQKFTCLHRVYGASNVSRMLEEMPENLRADGVESLYYEAKCRLEDPVYGCAGVISSLHRLIQIAECELAKTQVEILCLAAGLAVVEPTPIVDDEQLGQENWVDHDDQDHEIYSD